MSDQNLKEINTEMYPQGALESKSLKYLDGGMESQQTNAPASTIILPDQYPSYQPLNFNESQPLSQRNPLTQMQESNIMVQPPQFPQQQQVIVVIADPINAQVPAALPSRVKSRYPREIRCPSCGTQGITSTKSMVGQGSWAMALGLFCFGCWPCAVLPFFIPDCMDVQHTCSNCGSEVGRRQFLCDD